MKNNDPILIEEEKEKEYKKYPNLSLFCLFSSLVLLLISVFLPYLKDFEKVYTYLYLVSIILLFISFNLIQDYKLILSFGSILLVIYTFISGFIYTNDMMSYQFPIIGIIFNILAIIEELISYIKTKKIYKLIFLILLLISSIAFISLFNIDHRLINTLFISSFIVVDVYYIVLKYIS